MTKHTKGPWVALPEECDKPYIRIRGTRLGERYKICNVLTPVYKGVLDKEVEETRGNAHLIEAAPELLEVLKMCWDLGIDSTCVPAVRAAIAKAEGEKA